MKSKLFSTESIQKKQTLLEKAKTTEIRKTHRNLTSEELELVSAWLNDEIQLKQVMAAIGKNSGQAYVLLAIGARELNRINSTNSINANHR